jgi:iron complex transport system substrate-binding protein
MTIEAVVARAKDADIWLDPGLCRSLAELSGADERYTVFRAFRTGQVYNNNALTNAAGGDDIWETGVANPDRVLADLISIIHPELLPQHKLTWYCQLPAKVQASK